MSSLFGIYQSDGAPVTAPLISMHSAATDWIAGDGGMVQHEGVGLGIKFHRITAEDAFEVLPRWQDRKLFVASARLDNRGELCRKLGITDRLELPDSALIFAAFQKFGDDCVLHCRGDWVFALWDATRQQLLLARDATGNTGLYWWQQGDTLLFASELKTILAHPKVVARPDFRFVGRVLTAFSDPDAVDASSMEGIHRLVPGHCLTASKQGVSVRRWWQPETLAPVYYRREEDYYEAFVELYRDAVGQCLRVGEGSVASTLSCGLDSGSVVALAAPQLATQGKQLRAYVHRPHFAPTGAGPDRTGDEYHLALATATHVGNVDLVGLHAANRSVVESIRNLTQLILAPNTGTNNFWLQELLEHCARDGNRVLLTGQHGNATVSFDGTGNLWPLIWQNKFAIATRQLFNDQHGIARGLKQRLLKPAVRPALGIWRCHDALSQDQPWADYSPINPNKADEICLVARMALARHDPHFRHHAATFMRGWRLGTLAVHASARANYQQRGMFHRIAIRDATAAQAVTEYCWRLPDRIFWANGMQRGLIRQGMRDLLPKEVLFCQKKGQQAADLLGRMQTELPAIQSELERFASHPLCQDWLNLPTLRALATELNSQHNPQLFKRVATLLCRGLGVGMFLSRF